MAAVLLAVSALGAGCSEPAKATPPAPRGLLEALYDPGLALEVLPVAAQGYTLSTKASEGLVAELSRLRPVSVLQAQPFPAGEDTRPGTLARLAPGLAATSPHAVRVPPFLVGSEHAEPGILGFANSRAGFVVIYMDRLDVTGARSAAPFELPLAQDVERTVLVHEFGHLFGLVDCGIPAVVERSDPDSACHSAASGSVMWAGIHHEWTLEQVLRDGAAPIGRFDQHDWEDLRHAQGRFAERRGHGG